MADTVSSGSSISAPPLLAQDCHVERVDGAMGSYLASPSFPRSAEYVLRQAGIPQFVLDLRKAAPDHPRVHGTPGILSTQ